MGDDLMTLPEVALLLRRPEATLRQWRHKGYGPPSFRIGGSVVYRAAAVRQWVAEQERTERDDVA